MEQPGSEPAPNGMLALSGGGLTRKISGANRKEQRAEQVGIKKTRNLGQHGAHSPRSSLEQVFQGALLQVQMSNLSREPDWASLGFVPCGQYCSLSKDRGSGRAVPQEGKMLGTEREDRGWAGRACSGLQLEGNTWP